MKTGTRFLAVVAAVLMLATAFSACSATPTPTTAGTTNPTTAATEAQTTVAPPTAAPLAATAIKIVFPGDPPKALEEVDKAIADKLANDSLPFTLNYTWYPWDQYWDKLALVAASGEEQDLTWTHITTISGLVNKKALAPLDDALQAYGQNLMSSTPSYEWKEMTFNGKIYGIPRVMPIADSVKFTRIRGDLRKKYGIPEITTMAGFEQYLAAIKANEPDMVPYYGEAGGLLFREYGDVFTPIGDGMQIPVYIDPADPTVTVKSFFESDIYKNMMAKERDWMAKGYIPTDPYDKSQIPDVEAALNSGKLAATWGVVMKVTETIDAFKAGTPSGDLENVYLYPDKPKYLFNTTDNLISVFSTSKHVNESVAFMNWMRANQDNYDLFSLGIKDVNYKLDGDSVSYDGIPDEHSYGAINWAWNDIRFVRFSKYLSADYTQSLRNWDKDAVTTKITGFSFNQEPVKTEMAQLNAVMGEYVPQLYHNDIPWDTTLATFVQKLKDAGLDKVITECQTQVNAYIAK